MLQISNRFYLKLNRKTAFPQIFWEEEESDIYSGDMIRFFVSCPRKEQFNENNYFFGT